VIVVNDQKVPPRILIVGPEPSLPHGIAEYVRSLSTYLSTVPDVAPSFFNETAIKGHNSDPSRGNLVSGSLRMLHAYIRTIRSTHPHVVHLNSAYGRSFYEKTLMAQISRRLGAPAVVHLHSSSLERDLLGLSPRRRKWFSRALAPPNHTIALSEGMALLLRKNLPEVEVTVIANSVELVTPRPAIRGEPVRFGFIGVLIGRKGEADLLRAMADSKNRSYELLIAGDGASRQGAEALSVALGLTDRVRFLGVVRGQAKDQFFRDIDALCLPSYGENLPISLLESMAYGRPVIATSVGGVPEMVRDGTDGWLVTPGDLPGLSAVLDEAASDPEILRQRGEAGWKRVKTNYTWETNGPKQLQVYRMLSGK